MLANFGVTGIPGYNWYQPAKQQHEGHSCASGKSILDTWKHFRMLIEVTRYIFTTTILPRIQRDLSSQAVQCSVQQPTQT
jgi:hypothetical protein